MSEDAGRGEIVEAVQEEEEEEGEQEKLKTGSFNLSNLSIYFLFRKTYHVTDLGPNPTRFPI